MLLFLFGTVSAGRKAFAVFAVMLFPAMDVTTDIIYLVSTRFYNFPFFIVCMTTLIGNDSTHSYSLTLTHSYLLTLTRI